MVQKASPKLAEMMNHAIAGELQAIDQLYAAPYHGERPERGVAAVFLKKRPSRK
jgi:hypothetical protein